jgi:hypothetical protein
VAEVEGSMVVKVSERAPRVDLRCAYCHDVLRSSRPIRCRGCKTLMHAVCAASAVRCPTLGCRFRFSRGSRIRAVPRVAAQDEAGGLRLRRMLGAVFLPLLAFGLAEAGFSEMLQPEWHSDSWDTWWKLALSPTVHRFFYPLIVWAMVSFAVAECGGRGGWVQTGLIGGLVLSGVFSLLFLPLLPLSFVGIIVFGVGLLGFTPFLAFGTYLGAFRRYRRRRPAEEEFTPNPVGVWLGLSGLMTHEAVLQMVSLHEALPEHRPDCYLATVAAQGDPERVGSAPVRFANGQRLPVTRQLRVFKAAELALRVTLPWVHRPLRALYDVIGPPLARRMGRRAATLAHFVLIPCQLLAQAWLRACFLAPDVLVETTYVDR